MSAVDLKRLVVRKRYFVPLKPSQIEKATLKTLNSYTYQPLYDVETWFVGKWDEKCWSFALNLEHLYIMARMKIPWSKARVIALSKEFRANSRDNYFGVLKSSVSGEPIELTIYTNRIEANGCLIEAEVKPILYHKIVQLGETPKEYEIQHSYLSSERFLKTIFEIGLSATTVSEDKPMIPRPIAEFLINDSFTRQITERLEQMLEGATAEILIMGWIGTYFISKFKELKEKGIDIFVVTGNTKEIRQDTMQKEKAKAFTELINIVGKTNICVKPEFHGRMVVVDNKAMIGSADLDSYSLTGTRIEFAAYTEEPSLVLSLRNYFKQAFSPLKETPE
jgi:hypothetical protein